MESGSNDINSIKNVRYKILTMAFLLLVIIMSFSGMVNYMTFASNYNNSLVNTYAVAGNELVRKIEYALSYGKPINNYYGMNDTLNELKDVIPEVEEVKIVSANSDVLYDLNGFVRDSQLPNELLKAAVFKQNTVNENLSYQFYEGKAYLFIRINDNDAHHVASLAMVFPKGTFLQLNSMYTKQLVGYLVGIAMITLVILAIVFFKTKFYENNVINKKKVLFIFIAVLGSAQLLYSGVNYFLFKNAYIDMSYKSKDFIQNIVEKNIESVYTKGISLQNIEGFDKYLNSIKDSLPQIDDVSLVPSGELNSQNPQEFNRITITVSNDYVGQQMNKILLDMLTVLVISIFFMIELTLLAVIIMIKNQTKGVTQGSSCEIGTSHGLVRSLSFLVNICVFMSITFVPIVMKNLYLPLLGLPKDVVLGLPLSAEMLGGVLAIFLAGWLIDKKGWRAIFYIGVLFLAGGNLLSGLSASAIPFVFSRAIAGLGVGFIMMALRSLVVSLPEKNTAIAEFGSGSIAGLNCGAVIGGMLADRIGYDAIFYLAAITAVIPFIFARRLLTEFEIEVRVTSSSSALEKFINFITDKKAVVFLACIFIPFFVSGAFLDYYFPLFASSNNLTQSDISRGFLLNGLFIIYLGPILTRYASNKLGNTNGIIMSLFIVVCALATFILFGTVTSAFVTIVLLGIAESFGVSMKTNYFLNLKGIKDLEINKGIAYFSVMVNLSRMAGPIIYGVALSLGMRMGVGLISLVILMLLLVFIFLTKFKPTHHNTSETG
ncbi:MAG: MFS transporter [Firmicutes bacterium]|nr:MFS transporter [Bacillota bacterium]